PLGYQNKISYKVNDLYLNTKYRYKYHKYAFFSQLDLHQLYNQLETIEDKQTQFPFFVNPKIGIVWEINKINKLSTSYSYNTTNASILEVYNQYILTGFRSFSKGTGIFNQTDASTIHLNYTLGNWGEKFFATAFLMYNKNHDFFSTNSTISQNYSQSEKIYIKDRESITFSSNIDRYFKTISSNLKLTLDASKSNYKNSVNNADLREVKSKNINYGLELRSGFRGIFNYHIGSKWNFNEIKTSSNHSFTNNMSFLDLFFIFSEKLDIKLQTERYFFGSLDSNNNTYNFLDLEARYTVKENKLTFSLSGNNLFNTTTFKNYSISDISISKTEYRILPRYLLLKMEYRF
ncbi:MAG: TonB-dependent receptor, partial [Flavobacteriaceae bacterium]|nr:TonB-dependent receptor [Flavobacteriaceae bacterium]